LLRSKIKRYPNEVVLIVNDTDRLWLTNWYDSVNFITKQELRDSNLEIILGEFGSFKLHYNQILAIK
jgi:glutathione peroxidase-family protein